MSDAQPDRKEAGDAPEAPRNLWTSWLMWLVLAPVLYVLSIGPANWLGQNGCLPAWAFTIYTPLDYLPPSITTIINLYMDLWVR